MSPGPAPRVVVFVDRPDWHTRRLARAFAKQGVEPHLVALSRCGFATEGSGIAIPGFGDDLPDLAFVRTVATGTFEQVTHRLGILHALGAMGVAVVNEARAIERCVDKSTASAIFHRAGLPTPPTWSVETRAAAAAIAAREVAAGHRLVAKPLFGSQGRGLKLVAAPDDLPPEDSVAGLYYLQRLVAQPEGQWRDWRVFVVGGRAVAAMIRRGTHWITNVRQGAACEAQALDDDTGKAIARLAVAAAEAVGARHAGVDLIAAPEGPQVLEVNSMPAWHGLQGVTATDIAAALAADALSLVRR